MLAVMWRRWTSLAMTDAALQHCAPRMSSVVGMS
jgi:hypothetical protein